jgi:hypothetical protein
MVYKITQISGLGFLIPEGEWDEVREYFEPNNDEAFIICEKQEILAQPRENEEDYTFLVYYYFIAEKSSLITHQIILSEPEDNGPLDQETSIKGMEIDTEFSQRIEHMKRKFHLNAYKKVGYWSIMTSYAVEMIGNNNSGNFDDFRIANGYP